MQGVNPASFPTGPFAPTLLHPGPLPGSASEARGGEFYFTASRAAVPTSVFSPGNTERELLGALSARIHKKGPDPAQTRTSQVANVREQKQTLGDARVSSTTWLAPPPLSLSEVNSVSHVRLFVTLWTVAYQASPSMGFSRQEYWSGLPFPSPGDLPNPGIEPGSPAL